MRDDGLTRCSVDSVAKLKAQFPSLREELNDYPKFKEIYRFAFNFGKEPDQKILGASISILHGSSNLRCACDRSANGHQPPRARDGRQAARKDVHEVPGRGACTQPSGVAPLCSHFANRSKPPTRRSTSTNG